MSVYNFNHQEHHVNNNHHTTSLVASNGNQSRCNVRDNEHYQLVGRAFPAHQSDNMSAQLNTLSKTAMLVRQRRAMLEQLSCYLCKGYLIDATTVDECMDSFCKSCIVIYLRNHNNCPKCGTLIHKTNPLSTIRSDKVLQDIVYKLVPGLYDDEMKRRREFYRGMYAISSDEDDEDGSSGSYAGRGSNLSGEQHGIVSHPKPFYKPTDSIDLSIEPQSRGDSPAIYYDNKMQSIVTCFTGNLQQQQPPPLGQMFSKVDGQQFKTYLRCPAKLTALQLKKFIAAKFNICKDDTIHLLYLNESLKDEYSLIDIAYIYDWRGIEHMRLLYIIERDLSKTKNLEDSQIEGRLRDSKHCQSVGTSTQTVKRVCIDPHPKFYEETSNSAVNTNSSGRNMRPRTDQQSKYINADPTQLAPQQAPILRSNHNTVASNGLQTTAMNGSSNRNLVASSSSGNGSRTCSVVVRPPPSKNAVSCTKNELSSSNQHDSSRDTRVSRKLGPETATCSIPKLNINLHTLQRNQNASEKNVSTYSKVDVIRSNSPKESNNNSRQLVPYTVKDSISRPTMSGPTQSSLVTLANFTESRSNHVVSMNHSSASVTTMSNSYNSIAGMGVAPKVEVVPKAVKNDQTPPKTSRIALSFVTERGIIVRGLNRQETEFNRPSGSSISEIERNNHRSAASSIAVLPSSNSQTVSTISNIGQARYSTSPQLSSPSSNRSVAGSMGTQTVSNNAGTLTRHEGTTSTRHHLKVKPIYKHLVDPTKVKSLNFKKLGYTTRH